MPPLCAALTKMAAKLAQSLLSGRSSCRLTLGSAHVDAHALLVDGLASHLRRRIAGLCSGMLTFSHPGPPLLWPGFRCSCPRLRVLAG